MSDVLENVVEEELVSNITDEINFVETDAEVIAADLISRFEEYLGESLYPGDERRIFLQSIAYVLADQLIHINETGRSNLLRYAEGSELDALGEFYNNARLEANYATVTVRFKLSNSQPTTVIVPKGTRVTPDGQIFFATDEDIIFDSNTIEFEKDVTATATVGGAGHNDFAVGKIDKIVDAIPYITSVTNTTISGGGSDRETDDEYRERLRLSPFTFSVAGPANAYRAIALSASGDVSDVAVYSPSAGVVEIAVIKDGGEIPSEDDEILKTIAEACNAKDVRPLTDNVRIVPATGVDINVNVKYYIANNDTSKATAIQNAVDEYCIWQVGKLGRDINPDKLITMLFNAGAARVEVTEPAYQPLESNEIACINSVALNYGGSISM